MPTPLPPLPDPSPPPTHLFPAVWSRLLDRATFQQLLLPRMGFLPCIAEAVSHHFGEVAPDAQRNLWLEDARSGEPLRWYVFCLRLEAYRQLPTVSQLNKILYPVHFYTSLDNVRTNITTVLEISSRVCVCFSPSHLLSSPTRGRVHFPLLRVSVCVWRRGLESRIRSSVFFRAVCWLSVLVGFVGLVGGLVLFCRLVG